MARILERRGRDKLHIIAEILDSAKDGTLKTHLMYRANLSFNDVTAYLALMLRINFLEKIKKDGKLIYKTTEKGNEFLLRYREITELVQIQSKKEYKGESPK